jgi:hypothetical protein
MADAIWNNRFILADPGKNETVLWQNDNGTLLKNGITLSESRLNFEYIRILYSVRVGAPAYIDVPMFGLNRGASFILTLTASFNNHAYNEAGYFIIWQCFMADCTDTYLKSSSSQFIGKMNFIDASTPGTWTQGANADVPTVYKVIGFNRVSGGN